MASGDLDADLEDQSAFVDAPRGDQEMARRISRATEEITDRTDRTVRVDDLAEYLEWSIENVLVGLEAGTAHFSISLDAPTADADVEEPMSLGEHLGHEDNRFGLVEAKLALSAASTRLPYLERETPRLRVDQDMKQVDIAHRTGCSQMQISRLLRRAVLRLRELTDPEPGL